ncbi:DUF4843 domain-containing protein [Gelidibacter maritimus]|uniref:DUF4843 domain-containing protein n=1 Tax=Gelidibacter maritimus TaxID=2761487 RepID=A0A7W2M3Z3_9FLAO|nr:DUF4843 domain-containing protein [Gelidibacter maritimus]MBA6152046.1 DUF4843 domain-containing protein [Gelidibacter maritimus]
MKQINKIFGVLLLLIALSGCNNKYLEYDESLSTVRFIYNIAEQDSVTYSFALHPGVSEDVIDIPIQLIGLTSPVDREVGVEIDKEKTTAKENDNFIIGQSVIQADSITGKLRVNVKKTSNLEDESLVIAFKLSENANFASSPIDKSTYKIILTSKLIEPSDWPFNEYSRVKHEFVIKVTGKGTNYSEWNAQELIYYIGELNKALYEYNKEHPGDFLTDENGLLVTF